MEAEVDPTFERSSYRLEWRWFRSRIDDADRVVIDIENSHVRESFKVWCKVISHRDWQRLGAHDDLVVLSYKVLPPPS